MSAEPSKRPDAMRSDATGIDDWAHLTPAQFREREERERRERLQNMRYSDGSDSGFRYLP